MKRFIKLIEIIYIFIFGLLNPTPEIDYFDMSDNARGRRRSKSQRKAHRKAKKSNRQYKRAKRKTKRLAKKVVRKKKKAVRRKKAKKLIKKTIGTAALLPLAPFKPVMRKMLNKKGVTVSRRISMIDLVTKFYNTFVKKGSHYDELLPSDWYEHDESFYIPIEEAEYHDNAVLAIASIVSAIVGFFKEMHARKKAGEKLSGVEKIAADKGGAVIENVKDEVKAIKNNTWLEGGTGQKPPDNTLMLVAAVLVLFFVMKK